MISFFIACFSAHAAAASNAVSKSAPRVSTELGTIIGEYVHLSGHELERFRGVPFAQPPIDALRWQPPQPPLPFGADFHATTWAPSCPNTLNPPAPFCRTCSTRSNPPVMPNSEDCLYLNIVTPRALNVVESKLPVMAFIHGGGGYMGSAPIYSNSSALVNEGIILVTLQYRLGLLGWLPHHLLSQEQGGISGNYAVQDMISALTWIHKHIHAFGGDASSVTVFGQSFGGSAMHYLLLSPSARGLFHRVVVESAGLDLDNFWSQDLAESYVGANVFAELGCSDLPCARQKPWQQIMDLKEPSGALVLPVYSPSAANATFPLSANEALHSGRVNQVPVIFGHNSMEEHLDDYFSGKPFNSFASQYDNATVRTTVEQILRGISHPPRPTSEITSAAAQLLGNNFYPLHDFPTGYDRLGAIKSDASPGLAAWLWALIWSRHAPSFLYVFDAGAVGCPAMAPFGPMHLLELTFLLGDTYIIDRQGCSFDPEELAVGNQLRRWWTHFASRGYPAEGWTRFSKANMEAMVIRTDGSGQMVHHWHGDVILGFQADWQGYRPLLAPAQIPSRLAWDQRDLLI